MSHLRRRLRKAVNSRSAPVARDLLSSMWCEQENHATASLILKTHEDLPFPYACKARVEVLRSHTVEPIVPLMRAGALLDGLELDVHTWPFGVTVQPILDPKSDLYASNVDIIVLAIDLRDLAPELWVGGHEDYRKLVDRVSSLVSDTFSAFRRNSSKPLIVHGFDRPVSPAAGVHYGFADGGQLDSIGVLNRRIRESARGYRDIYVIELDGLVASHGRQNWYDDVRWEAMGFPYSPTASYALAREWRRYLYPLAGRQAKVVVCDLDGTLWGGVLGEDGSDGIGLGPKGEGRRFGDIQRALLDLRSRGILLAVCSKNDEEQALAVIKNDKRMVLQLKHFSAVRINWKSKAQNLTSIAEELNLGIESLAFLDDNPSERALVRQVLPECQVMEFPSDRLNWPRLLREHPAFERLHLSQEDRDRPQMYADEKQRRDFEEASLSLPDYLCSLDIVVAFEEIDGANLARAAQLTQKTNQFNTTTMRFSQEELSSYLRADQFGGKLVRVADRFGDNGLVGMVLVRTKDDDLHVDNLLLSCRVIGKGVETALLHFAAEEARKTGASRLVGSFVPTERNGPASDVFERHGFRAVRGALWEHGLETPIDLPNWINVREPAAPMEAEDSS